MNFNCVDITIYLTHFLLCISQIKAFLYVQYRLLTWYNNYKATPMRLKFPILHPPPPESTAPFDHYGHYSAMQLLFCYLACVYAVCESKDIAGCVFTETEVSRRQSLPVSKH